MNRHPFPKLYCAECGKLSYHAWLFPLMGLWLGILIGIIISFVLAGSVFGQDFRFTDPEADKWLGDDKMIHAFGSYVLVDALKIIEKDEKKAAIYTFFLGFLFEIKDGFFRYEKYGRWGGDGFSIKDTAANAIGIGLNLLAHKILKGKIHEQTGSYNSDMSGQIGRMHCQSISSH